MRPREIFASSDPRVMTGERVLPIMHMPSLALMQRPTRMTAEGPALPGSGDPLAGVTAAQGQH
jgi:hypothetical protein